jgi:cellulose synthase/poly-beta-1,6-N-acetylglucosamine synthase-like glycosyltransferase
VSQSLQLEQHFPTPQFIPVNDLKLLSIVIPARDEEGCIASTVEHLHLELKLKGGPHEIVVVDDGSRDRTWEILCGLREQMTELLPVQNAACMVLVAQSCVGSRWCIPLSLVRE